MCGTLPGCSQQACNASEQDSFDSREDVKTANAWDSPAGQLCRFEPGTPGQNLPSEQLGIRRGDRNRSGDHAEWQVDPPKDDQFEIWYEHDPMASKTRGSARQPGR